MFDVIHVDFADLARARARARAGRPTDVRTYGRTNGRKVEIATITERGRCFLRSRAGGAALRGVALRRFVPSDRSLG